MNADTLRQKHPEFIYRGYAHTFTPEGLRVEFSFLLSPDIEFHPSVFIEGIHEQDAERVGEREFSNFLFHLGLAEIPSYWKCAISPKIRVEAGSFTDEQISWWKDLIFKGMGEFFYVNRLDFRGRGFLSIVAEKAKRQSLKLLAVKEREVLVPIGGGKDSIVTLELLKNAGYVVRPLVLNPKTEQEEILHIAAVKPPIIVRRTIDPELLELNREGYLNGHTPFSSYLAILSTICAGLLGIPHVALSNEKSASEGNAEYLGMTINHQYSKSVRFEGLFRAYARKYLAPGIEYFSFLRPLSELQIAKIFSNFPQYFNVFLSCNEAHKTKSGTVDPKRAWCGSCAKCLFVWIVLAPFLSRQNLVSIFNKDLLEDASLLPLLQELTGEKGIKPFECVGTTKEVKAALLLISQKEEYTPFPVLLKKTVASGILEGIHPAKVLKEWSTKNFLPKEFEKVLARAAGI